MKSVSSNLKQHYRSYIGLALGIIFSIWAGYLTFYLLNDREETAFESDYNVLSDGVVFESGVALTRLDQSAQLVSHVLGTEFPDAVQWPFVAHSRYVIC